MHLVFEGALSVTLLLHSKLMPSMTATSTIWLLRPVNTGNKVAGDEVAENGDKLLPEMATIVSENGNIVAVSGNYVAVFGDFVASVDRPL